MDLDDETLPGFLHAHREAELSVVAGMDEEAGQRSVVPSGWTRAEPASDAGRTGLGPS